MNEREQMEYLKDIVMLIISNLEGRKAKIGNQMFTYGRPEEGEPQMVVPSSRLYSIYTADVPRADYSIDRTIILLFTQYAGIAYQIRVASLGLKRLQLHVNRLAEWFE